MSDQFTTTIATLKLDWSDHYKRNVIILHDPGQTDNLADVIIENCREHRATVIDDEGEQFVVTLRPEIGPELWSEETLRRSLPTDAHPR